MPAYRIYWLDQNDHVAEADYLIADADDDVRAGATAYLGMASAVEGWHHARRVVRVSADKPLAELFNRFRLPWQLLSLQRKNTSIVGLFGAILDALPPDLAEQVKSLDTADDGIRVTLRTRRAFRFLPNTA